jgi:hypothetical protein
MVHHDKFTTTSTELHDAPIPRRRCSDVHIGLCVLIEVDRRARLGGLARSRRFATSDARFYSIQE